MRSILAIWLAVAAGAVAQKVDSYAIVISQNTAALPEWEKVAAALAAKYPGAVRVTWRQEIGEALPELARRHPRFVAVVCQPQEATLALVRGVHRLTRKFDADPYTDCQWGIVTGFDAANALAMAREAEPLVIRHTLSGTEIAVDRCESAQWFSELKAGLRVTKTPDGKVTEAVGAADSSVTIAEALEDARTGLFVTSGHATERGWQIGFSYPNGHWASRGGKLMAVDLKGASREINSPRPKVYLAVGNCLMGHIDGPDAMALAFMNRAGVRQMVGYTLPTWYGYQGWGMLDYFVEQPGRFTLNQAFFANNHALVHRLETCFPEVAREVTDSPMGRLPQPVVVGPAAKAAGLTAQDANGLLFDRDVVAFYGDPAWEARMAPGKLQWQQEWRQDPAGGSLEFVADPRPVNTNGSQRGGRPVIQYFTHRINPATVKVTAGAEFNPVITDDFILVPMPQATQPAPRVKVTFTAEPAAKGTAEPAAAEPASAASPGWQPLFDGKSLDGWKRADFAAGADLNVVDGELRIGLGEPHSGMVRDGEPPARMDYEIELEAKRTTGHDFFCGLTFPVDRDPCTLICGGWGGSVVGLSNIDGLDASENPTATVKEFTDGTWYRIRLRVTRAAITAWIDDREVISQELAEHKISIRREVQPCVPLGISTWQTGAAFRHLRWRSLGPAEQDR